MITLTISEKEILENPNNYSLGEYIRRKFEHEKLIYENSYDKCVICGKESPYTCNAHIDLRIGYIEGGGQGCFQPNQCEK